MTLALVLLSLVGSFILGSLYGADKGARLAGNILLHELNSLDEHVCNIFISHLEAKRILKVKRRKLK